MRALQSSRSQRQYSVLVFSAIVLINSAGMIFGASIWQEDFNSAEKQGKGIYGDSSMESAITNMNGITNWTVSGADGVIGDSTLNWWMATNSWFEGQDVGDVSGHWQSRSIDVSSATQVRISMDFDQLDGGFNSSGEKMEIGYILDEGSNSVDLTIDENNQDTYDDSAWNSSVIDVSSATGLVVTAAIEVNGADDGWAFDNVLLETVQSGQPPVIESVGDQAIAAGQALSFEVKASDPVDGDSVELFASNVPPGAVFGAATNVASVTNTFTWSDPEPVGVYTTLFYAADKDGIDSEPVKITVAGTRTGSDLWINEFHYNNAGADTNEGVEVAGPAGWDLSAYTLCFYNGNDGSEYGSTSLWGVVDSEINDRGVRWFAHEGIQNGAPDGIALVSSDGDGTSVVQFLSYGGTFIASDGPASGLMSTECGVLESDSAPADMSLQLQGSGYGYPDFTWAGPTNHSRGSINTGQTIRKRYDHTVIVIE